MRTSLIIASFGAALSALTAGIAPGKAEPVTNAYPYCLLGRGGGSTTCYFKSLEECGHGCINNPGYVGEARARLILAGAGIASDSGRATAKANRTRNASRATPPSVVFRPSIDPGARASAGRNEGFEGWPTGYLTDRFGDHQAQGRL